MVCRAGSHQKKCLFAKLKASLERQGADLKGNACNAGRDGACEEVVPGPEVLQDFASGLKGQQGVYLRLRSLCWRGQSARELVVRQLQTAPQRSSAQAMPACKLAGDQSCLLISARMRSFSQCTKRPPLYLSTCGVLNRNAVNWMGHVCLVSPCSRCCWTAARWPKAS